MPDNVKTTAWDMYLNQFTQRIAELERNYQWPTENEFSGDMRDPTRAVRFSADAVSYIQRVTQEFIQDFIRDALAIAELDRKKTVNFNEHMLPMIAPCSQTERASDSIKRREARECKIAETARKWKFLGEFFNQYEKESLARGEKCITEKSSEVSLPTC